MEIMLHIKSEVNAVLLVNGTFVERADAVRCNSAEPVYLTLLPLEAIYLPYTVKLLGAKPLTNTALCSVYDVGGDRFLVRLKGRYNYVYSPASAASEHGETGLVPRFFRAVKDGSFAAARACMTNELSATVSDEALADFFEEYCDVAENVYTSEGGWFLLKKDGQGARFTVQMRSGLIDNIEEG